MVTITVAAAVTPRLFSVLCTGCAKAKASLTCSATHAHESLVGGVAGTFVLNLCTAHAKCRKKANTELRCMTNVLLACLFCLYLCACFETSRQLRAFRVAAPQSHLNKLGYWC